MTTVTGVVKTATKKVDRSKWIFSSELRGSGDDDSIVSTSLNVVTPNAEGLLTVELDPGPVTVKYGNTTVRVTVPDVPTYDLWDLIGASVLLPPITTDAKLLAAFLAFLDAHPVALDDMTSAVQASLAKADSAVQPATLASAVAAAVSGLIAGAPGTRDTLKEISDILTADEGAMAALTSVVGAKVGLVQAAKNPDLLVTGAVTLDANDLITAAAVVWPDGSPGTMTITSRDANGAVLAYNITYGSPVTKTFTQPAITRNANGAATNVPAIVVS